MQEAEFSGIMDAVYGAAAAHERWPAALDRLGRAFGCNGVVLIDRNMHTMQGRLASVGFDTPSEREFINVWSDRDILRLRTRVFRAGAVETDRQIVPKRDLLKSDVYNGFMKPRDVGATMRATISVETDFRTVISLLRPVSAGEFEKSDVAHGHLLMPHLQRAVSVMRHVEQSKLMLGAFSDVLEQSARGVLILDRSGKILFASRAARAMAQTGESVTLRSDRIAALNSRDDAALQQLIAGATGRADRIDAPHGGMLRLPRKAGTADLVITAAPLAGETPWTPSGPVAFVLISDPDAMLETSGDPQTQMTERMTARELECLRWVAAGKTDWEIGTILSISATTVKFHVNRARAKLGARTRAQAVARLVRSGLY